MKLYALCVVFWASANDSPAYPLHIYIYMRARLRTVWTLWASLASWPLGARTRKHQKTRGIGSLGARTRKHKKNHRIGSAGHRQMQENLKNPFGSPRRSNSQTRENSGESVLLASGKDWKTQESVRLASACPIGLAGVGWDYIHTIMVWKRCHLHQGVGYDIYSKYFSASLRPLLLTK